MLPLPFFSFIFLFKQWVFFFIVEIYDCPFVCFRCIIVPFLLFFEVAWQHILKVTLQKAGPLFSVWHQRELVDGVSPDTTLNSKGIFRRRRTLCYRTYSYKFIKDTDVPQHEWLPQDLLFLYYGCFVSHLNWSWQK